MRNRVSWEWVLEYQDEHGDIVETDTEDAGRLGVLLDRLDPEVATTWSLGAARLVGNDLAGLLDRDYFYPDSAGRLVSEDGEAAPAYIQREHDLAQEVAR